MDNNKNKLIINYEPNLTEKNIEYVFQRLLFSIVSASGFELYTESMNEFDKILNIVKKWIVIYANTKDISKIDWNEFVLVRQQLFELDSRYISVDGFYAAECYEWILQLQVLLEKSFVEGNDFNGL